MKPILVKTKSCPECSKDIPIYEGEGTWCNHCDWNLFAEKENEKNVFKKYHAKIGKKISHSLFEEMMSANQIRPSLSFRKLITLAICMSIVSLPLVMAGVGYLSFFYLPRLIFVIVFLICIAIMYVPFTIKHKTPKNLIPRSEAPELYSLFNRISAKLDNTTISQVALTHDFNAFYTELGIGPFKKRYVSLGVPLISILKADELVALISHEVSHGANGDIVRGSVMWRALSTLAELYRMVRPKHADEGTHHSMNYRVWFNLGNYFGFALSMIPLSAYKLIKWLSLHDSQEAEYYADIFATEACGKSAMVAMLKKIRNVENFDLAVSKATTSHGKVNFYEEMQRLCSVDMSDHAILRFDRLEERSGLSLDATHPPTNYRIKYISKKGKDNPGVILSDSQFEKIKREFEGYYDKTAKQLIDDHLYRLA